ncbi:YncE family protein [Thalassotalea montiporae]
MKKVHYFLLNFILFFMLTGCGGGGTDNSNPNAFLSLSKNEVNFDATFMVSPSLISERVSGNVSNFKEGTLYLSAVLSDKGVVNAQATKLSVGNNSGSLEIVPGSHSELGPGLHTDTIEIRACNDQQCNSHIAGSPAFINVKYNIATPPSRFIKLSQDSLIIDEMLNSETSPALLTLFTSLEPTNIRIKSDFTDGTLKHAKLANRVHSESHTAIDFGLMLSENSNLPPGEHSGTIDVIAELNGHDLTLSVPTKILISPKLLQVSQQSVALTKFKSSGKLTQELSIYEITGSESFSWKAKTNVDWLQITKSDNSENSLKIEAQPDNLKTGTMHYAKVSISSDDDRINNVQIVNVGLWVSDSEQPEISMHGDYTYTTSLNSDPLRPFLYFTKEKSGELQIEAINYYTGSIAATIEVDGIRRGIDDIAISPSGEYLYILHVSETSDGSIGEHISVVNLFTNQVISKWYNISLNWDIAKIISPLGKDTLFSENYSSSTDELLAYDSFDGTNLGYFENLTKFNVKFDRKDSNYCYSSNDFSGEITENNNLTCGIVRYSKLQNTLGFDDTKSTRSSELVGNDVQHFSVHPNGKLVAVKNGNSISLVDTVSGEILSQFEPPIISNISNTNLYWSEDSHLLSLKYDNEDKKLFKFSIDGMTTQLNLNQYDDLIGEDLREAVYSADGLSMVLLFNSNKFATIQIRL